MQDALVTIGAWWGCAFRGRSYGLRRLYKLISTLLTLVPLLAPGMTAFDDLWMAALWALHGARSGMSYFYSNRMLKYFYFNRMLN